ncbi:MAG: glycerophosphodiester phosphodiesterase [Candidatus Pristimantibacillus sp.]
MRNPCVAHRGWSGLAPENTLAAIQMAIDEPNVDWVEIDVQLSKDSVPFVIHDFKLRRTTNGKGEVRDKMAVELASLDAGNWFSHKYRGEPLPTLDSVLHAAADRCCLNIELKTDGIRYPHLEERVLDRIHAHGLENNVILTSFHPGALNNVLKLSEGRVRTGLIVDRWRDSLPEELRQTKSDLLSIAYSKLNKERVQKLKQNNIQIMAWTLNDERSIRKIAALDPEIMICTNYPDRWRKAIAKL